MLGFLSTTAAQAQEMVSVARPEINLRAGPGTNHETTYSINRGFPLRVISRQGDWLKVRDFENDEGWVLSSLTNRTGHHIVKVRTANLRATASTSARIVAKAEYGEVLRTLAKRGTWVQVEDSQKRRGWIAANLVWGW